MSSSVVVMWIQTGTSIALYLLLVSFYAEAATGECLDGWLQIKESCVKVFNNPLNRKNAEGYCKEKNTRAHLLFILDTEMFEGIKVLRNNGVKEGNYYYWIGLKTYRSKLKWINGTNKTAAEYIPPRVSFSSSYPCWVIGYNSQYLKFYSYGCTYRVGFICQYSLEQRVIANISFAVRKRNFDSDVSRKVTVSEGDQVKLICKVTNMDDSQKIIITFNETQDTHPYIDKRFTKSIKKIVNLGLVTCNQAGIYQCKSVDTNGDTVAHESLELGIDCFSHTRKGVVITVVTDVVTTAISTVVTDVVTTAVPNVDKNDGTTEVTNVDTTAVTTVVTNVGTTAVTKAVKDVGTTSVTNVDTNVDTNVTGPQKDSKQSMMIYIVVPIIAAVVFAFVVVCIAVFIIRRIKQSATQYVSYRSQHSTSVISNQSQGRVNSQYLGGNDISMPTLVGTTARFSHAPEGQILQDEAILFSNDGTYPVCANHRDSYTSGDDWSVSQASQHDTSVTSAEQIDDPAPDVHAVVNKKNVSAVMSEMSKEDDGRFISEEGLVYVSVAHSVPEYTDDDSIYANDKSHVKMSPKGKPQSDVDDERVTYTTVTLSSTGNVIAQAE